MLRNRQRETGFYFILELPIIQGVGVEWEVDFSSFRSAGIESACHDRAERKKSGGVIIGWFDEGRPWCLADVLREELQEVQYLTC